MIYCSSSARMLACLRICVARLFVRRVARVWAVRDLVIALAHMFSRAGPVYHGSMTHVCSDGIYTARLLDTRFHGWDTLYQMDLGHIFDLVGSAGSKSFHT